MRKEEENPLALLIEGTHLPLPRGIYFFETRFIRCCQKVVPKLVPFLVATVNLMK
jgi:hypothetical protein